MTKAELVDKMAKEAGISKVAAKAALESFTDNVTATLKGGGKVDLVGFGTFSVSKMSCGVPIPVGNEIVVARAPPMTMTRGIRSRWAHHPRTCASRRRR